jgi:formylglycine-generating enzyme required for sulfatase activity
MRVRRLMAVLALAAGLVLFGATTPVWAVDSDGDGVGDLFDVCDNTPTGTPVDSEGRPLGDIDRDCDTDLDDYSLFQQGFTGPFAPPDMVIATVTVGNPGNPGEWSGESYGGYGPDRICGAVAYAYNIGRFEVTAGQYTEFLNAVAATDTYGLYTTYMDSDSYGCQITRNGTSGNYTYDFSGRPSGTEADWADRPVNYVSWGDAARFANWLHNGQPVGAQDLSTTEDGSYFLDGAMSNAELLAITREPDATWVIPSEDEWYKAAYHYNDGVTGNYWDYPTESDSMPTSEAPPGTDVTSGSANYFDGGWAIGAPYYRTEVGAYDAKPSDSPYGTFDQGANVWEWDEHVLYGSSRGRRGGSFGNNGSSLHAAVRNYNYPSVEDSSIGFRVSEVP